MSAKTLAQSAPADWNMFDQLDQHQQQVAQSQEPSHRSNLGQYMTPSRVSRFMAGMFNIEENVFLLDAGAGVGSLTTAFAARANDIGSQLQTEVWEIDAKMAAHLRTNLQNMGINSIIHQSDFVKDAVFEIWSGKQPRFTHAILNPPYRKIASSSSHRHLLRKAQIETVNLYAAFVALATLLLQDLGELVAIIPRSFCNGLYYRPFRELILNSCSIKQIHLFESRKDAFRDDKILQENVILHLKKGAQQGNVKISRSSDSELTDYFEFDTPFDRIVRPADSEQYIHIPLPTERPFSASEFNSSLQSLGLEISTGPVVDFRVRDYWVQQPNKGDAPLIYAHHFSGGRFEHPRKHKKPNALVRHPHIEKLLMPAGTYVVTKRFTSKEEPRRLVAFVITARVLQEEMWGFENHLNVFHSLKRGIDDTLAIGVATFLNSTSAEDTFRSFSGHTQVNATDLRTMKYPPKNILQKMGAIALANPNLRPDEVLSSATQHGQENNH